VKFSERIGLDLSSQICWSQISGREDHLERLLGPDIAFFRHGNMKTGVAREFIA